VAAVSNTKWRCYRKRETVRARRATGVEWIADRGGGTHDEKVKPGCWIIETWRADICMWTDEYQLSDSDFHEKFVVTRGNVSD
jgi:hypothetical protein